LKNLGPSQKTLRPPGVPSLVTSLISTDSLMLLLTQHRNTWLTFVGSHCLAALTAKLGCRKEMAGGSPLLNFKNRYFTFCYKLFSI